MEIIIKLIISFILFFILYKYIKNNYMIVFLSSIYMYKFYNLEIGFSKVLIELGIIIILYKVLDYLINSNQIMNRIFNITDIEIIKEGKIDFKKLKLINMNFEDLLKKLNYINIEDIKSCTFNNNDINIITYNNNPIPLIVDSKINFRNLILIKKNINWLNETLKRKETLLDEIFYAFYYNENIIIIKKSNIDK
ncbi:MAG: DUF421 domain-containing protein [Tenericutes bacterium]|nr:DUF421 domain-containing protein [Mycoplasmatota bacterium]